MSAVDGRRIGRFRISSALLGYDFRPELQALMSRVFILHAEHRYDENCFHYIAISDLFDPVAPGGVAPLYKVIIRRHRYVLMDVENFSVRFERVPDDALASALSLNWEAV